MKMLIQVICFLLAVQTLAQKNKNATPLKTTEYSDLLNLANWTFQQGKVEFLDYKGQKAMKLASRSGQVVLKDLVFKDGTIEFDVEPALTEFAQSIYFHRKDEKEQEIVYLRVGTAGNKVTNTAIQYTPYFDGINMWDMYPQFQGPAPFKKDDWNHLKLVISGAQMRVYLNYQPRPVLEIQKLEGNLAEGSIAFEGASYIANLQIKPTMTEGLDPHEGADLSNHDAYYLRKWAVSAPMALPIGNEVYLAGQPKIENYMDSISAERAGFINLTRRFGGNKTRKVVWLKTKIVAKETLKTKLQLGFSDEVWVFLNNQMILVDKNLFQQPGMRKYPEGRMSKDNASIGISLKSGDNDLTIAVANDFYGWGIVARLESADGVTSLDEISGIVRQAKEISNLDLEPYLGVYSNAANNLKLTFSKKDKYLVAKASNSNQEFDMQASGNHVFKIDQMNVAIEFRPGEKKLILTEGTEKREFLKE